MKLLTIICESFNRYDIGRNPEGFARYDFHVEPATFSEHSIFQMQTEHPYSDMYTDIFATPEKFLSQKAKTRLISNYWPSHLDPSHWDPRAIRYASLDGNERPMEPRCAHYGIFLSFLHGEFYQSDYRWLIYWPYCGHAGAGMNLRLPEEDGPPPVSLARTWEYWLSLLERDVWPLIRWDETTVLMHPDHGTARSGMDYKRAMWDGFLLARSPRRLQAPGRQLSWSDLRQTEQHAVDVEFFREGAECVFS